MSTTAVAKLNRLESALANATTVKEKKEIRDQAKALAEFLRKRDGRDGYHLKQNDFAALKLRAEYEIGREIPDHFPHCNGKLRSRKGTLKDAGISKNQASRWGQVAGIPKKRFDAFLESGKEDKSFELTTAAALELAKEIKKDKEREEYSEISDATVAATKGKLGNNCDLRPCSMEELLSDVREIDAIVTDPPYPEEFVPLYGKMAELAKLALKPDGLVAVMIGQSFLPRILTDMCQHLKYRWTMAFMTPNGTCNLYTRHVFTGWKPILIFGGEDYFNDVLDTSQAAEKGLHDWQQSEAVMVELLKKLTKPGQLICDPFLGAGTTATAALRTGRRFVGCDIEKECVNKAWNRLNDEFCSSKV